jgi:hypothetical protein
MTNFRKISKQNSRRISVLDFPDLRFIRAERLFRISIFGFRIFLANVLSSSEVLRGLRAPRGEIIAAIMTLALLNGCMVGPDYKRPSVEIPSQFRAATLSGAESIADLKWFEVFKDEQLQGLIRTALAQNYDLRDAIARVDAARANLGITRSNQFPQIGVGAAVPSSEESRQGRFTVPRGVSSQRTYVELFLSYFTY